MECKSTVIPVIIGATGTIIKSFRKYLNNIPRKHKIKELDKRAILDTAHILRKVPTEKCETNVGKNIKCAKNFNHRSVTPVYAIETQFV